MSAQDTPLCAVLLGNAPSEQEAAAMAAQMQNCPYVAIYTASGRGVMGMFVFPEKKRWWIQLPEEHPDQVGLQEATVFFSEHIYATSPWARGKVRPEQATAPCGADCGSCPHYHVPCDGCPSTQYYAGER